MSSFGYYEPKAFVVPSKLGASPTQKESISILLKKIIEMTQDNLKRERKSRFGDMEFLNPLEMFENSKPLRLFLLFPFYLLLYPFFLIGPLFHYVEYLKNSKQLKMKLAELEMEMNEPDLMSVPISDSFSDMWALYDYRFKGLSTVEIIDIISSWQKTLFSGEFRDLKEWEHELSRGNNKHMAEAQENGMRLYLAAPLSVIRREIIGE